MLFSVKSEKLPVFFMNMILKKTGNNSVGGHVFWLVTVRVLKSYEICKWQIE